MGVMEELIVSTTTSTDRSRRVLLVEDHEDTRQLLARLLSAQFEVRTAACYDTAMDSAALQVPHVVVTDIGLPGRDGVTLMRDLSRRYNVPGIAVTGHTPEDPGHFRDAGFVATLTKPISLDQLMLLLSETCRPR
jgi:DNA-binding response OmpR family regulator